VILLEIDPDVVKPGWTPLIVTVLLGIAVALLYMSMRRQFRRITIPRAQDESDEPGPAADPDTPEPQAGDPGSPDVPVSGQDPPAGDGPPRGR
jgi:hypothetical protein